MATQIKYQLAKLSNGYLKPVQGQIFHDEATLLKHAKELAKESRLSINLFYAVPVILITK